MPTCFVMQPFDGGTFDKRYEEVYAPAIRGAGLEPYRVDRDDAVSIPIDHIESGIRQSAICLAEISEDNPNVWFELGYAIASAKEVVLICASSRRERFPFDVQHRTIIKYDTSSPSDFERLQGNITAKLLAYLNKAETLEAVADSTQLVAAKEGLRDQEVFALASVVKNLDHEQDYVVASQVQRDLEQAGYTRIASNLALRSLTRQGFLNLEQHGEGYGHSHFGYRLTEAGWRWADGNQDRFALRRPPPPPAVRNPYARIPAPPGRPNPPKTGFDDMDDDIPF